MTMTKGGQRMIFLIGGPARCGKTTLAKKLAGRFRCPVISADWLRSVVLPYLPDPRNDKTVLENILYSRDKRGGQQTDAEEAQVLWPALRGFILDKSRWSGDFVIEGIQLTPEHLSEVLALDDLDHICAIVLVKSILRKFYPGLRK